MGFDSGGDVGWEVSQVGLRMLVALGLCLWAEVGEETLQCGVHEGTRGCCGAWGPDVYQVYRPGDHSESPGKT